MAKNLNELTPSLPRIKNLKNLKVLAISVKEIESIKFLRNHPSVESIYFDDTKIIDGDLEVLKTCPNLKDIVFTSKKFYNCSQKDIQAYIESK